MPKLSPAATIGATRATAWLSDVAVNTACGPAAAIRQSATPGAWWNAAVEIASEP
ncbi:hypothetical protein ACQ143_04635 [Microbacterium sp. MC2]